MQSKSLRQAMNDAKEASAKEGGGPRTAWEEKTYTLEVMDANLNTDYEAPSIGLFIQRSEDSRRQWFNLYFDESDNKSFHRTGAMLSDLGCDAIVDALDEEFPEDRIAQLRGLASALKGVQFSGEVSRYPASKGKDVPADNKELEDDDPTKVWRNSLGKVKELLTPPSYSKAPSSGDFGGFGGGAPNIMGG